MWQVSRKTTNQNRKRIGNPFTLMNIQLYDFIKIRQKPQFWLKEICYSYANILKVLSLSLKITLKQCF